MESSCIFNRQEHILKRQHENIHQWKYWEVQKNKIPFVKRRESIRISCCQRFSIIVTIKCKKSSRETLKGKNLSQTLWKSYCTHRRYAGSTTLPGGEHTNWRRQSKSFPPPNILPLPQTRGMWGSRHQFQGKAFQNFSPYQRVDDLMFHCRQHANKLLSLRRNHVGTQVSVSCNRPGRQRQRCDF